jgi:hypothetical protein
MAMLERFVEYLWPTGDLPTTFQVYALLDGARDGRLEPMIRRSRLEYCCLYGGRLTPALERAAPYLVHLTPEASFTRELIEVGWGQSRGILTVVAADCTMQQQRRHFRTLLQVRSEDGRPLIFRFYDPRVLRAYLPTCTPEEAANVFGPIPRLLAESRDARHALEFTRGETGVDVTVVPL